MVEYMVSAGYCLAAVDSDPLVYTDVLSYVWSSVSGFRTDRQFDWGSRLWMEYKLPGINSVVKFVDDRGRVVDVVFVIYSPMDIILGFHSSELILIWLVHPIDDF